jgi:hypothetical protein
VAGIDCLQRLGAPAYLHPGRKACRIRTEGKAAENRQRRILAMMVACRSPRCLDQAGLQSVEGVLVEDEPVVDFDNEAALRQSLNCLGKSLSGFAKELWVEQAVHAPPQHFLLTCGRTRCKPEAEGDTGKSTRDRRNPSHHLYRPFSAVWLAQVIRIAMSMLPPVPPQ